MVATGLHHLLHSGIASALGAAVLFGATTPLAKLLLGQMHPVILAGVLYLGSGVGLLGGWPLRRTVATRHRTKRDWTVTDDPAPDSTRLGLFPSGNQ